MDTQSKYITDKRTISQKLGVKQNFIKPNSKYEKIKPTINTGKTIKDVVVVSDKLISKKKSELFSRVSCLGIKKLHDENPLKESIYNINENNEYIDEVSAKDNKNLKEIEKEKDVISTFSITSTTQVGDLSKITNYIIIDLRDNEEYEDFHIVESVNMPYYNISRDKFPSNMYMMKNKMDKMIICYSLDERTSIPHCQLLYQKGFDNIYMLTGGIESFVVKYPELCEGKGMSRIMLEQAKKKEADDENNVKTKYSKQSGNSKASTVVNSNINKHLNEKKEGKEGNISNNGNVVSSKVSSVSGISSMTNKSSISALKKNLGVK